MEWVEEATIYLKKVNLYHGVIDVDMLKRVKNDPPADHYLNQPIGIPAMTEFALTANERLFASVMAPAVSESIINSLRQTAITPQGSRVPEQQTRTAVVDDDAESMSSGNRARTTGPDATAGGDQDVRVDVVELSEPERRRLHPTDPRYVDASGLDQNARKHIAGCTLLSWVPPTLQRTLAITREDPNHILVQILTWHLTYECVHFRTIEKQFNHLYQFKNETYTSYLLRARDLVTRIYRIKGDLIPEQTLIENAVLGLTPDHSKFIDRFTNRYVSIPTLSSLLRELTAVSISTAEVAERRAEIKRLYKGDVEKKHEGGDALLADSTVDSMSAGSAQRGRGRGRGKGRGNGRGNGDGNREKEKGESSSSKQTCDFCGRVGHKAEICFRRRDMIEKIQSTGGFPGIK
jgi:hypothetical protein